MLYNENFKLIEKLEPETNHKIFPTSKQKTSANWV